MIRTAPARVGLTVRAMRRSGAFAPIDVSSFVRTCEDLADAVRKNVTVVILVGQPGSGKTSVLAALHELGETPEAKLGRPAFKPRGVRRLRLDDVDGAVLERLRSAPDRRAKMVLAMGPELLTAALAEWPDALFVRVRPLSSADVRAVLNGRLAQAGHPPEALTARAASRMEDLCSGNPRRLDRLLGRAALLAEADGCVRITGEHVERVARRLSYVRLPQAPPPFLRLRNASAEPGRAAVQPPVPARRAYGWALRAVARSLAVIAAATAFSIAPTAPLIEHGAEYRAPRKGLAALSQPAKVSIAEPPILVAPTDSDKASEPPSASAERLDLSGGTEADRTLPVAAAPPLGDRAATAVISITPRAGDPNPPPGMSEREMPGVSPPTAVVRPPRPIPIDHYLWQPPI